MFSQNAIDLFYILPFSVLHQTTKHGNSQIKLHIYFMLNICKLKLFSMSIFRDTMTPILLTINVLQTFLTEFMYFIELKKLREREGQ